MQPLDAARRWGLQLGHADPYLMPYSVEPGGLVVELLGHGYGGAGPPSVELLDVSASSITFARFIESMGLLVEHFLYFHGDSSQPF